MSFSTKVKEELVSRIPSARHCQIAMLAAVICTVGRISIDRERKLQLTISSEQEEIHRLVESLYQKLFGFRAPEDARQVYKVLETVKLLHLTEDILKRKNKVLDEGSLQWDSIVLQRACCKRAFLKGLFLTSGSVNNPERAYHLEMVFQSTWMANAVCQILKDMDIEGKQVKRKKYDVVYIKDGSMIVDFLNVIGAPIALMEMENVRILKDVKNRVNRRVNCETANINKTVSASIRQIEDIELIAQQIGLDNLPGPLCEMARLRLEQPDASLAELGELADPPITKSGVNHRLRKLSQMASDLR